MKSPSRLKGILILASLVLLASCTSDPNKLKLKYLASGEHYFEAGKYPEAVIQFRNALAIDPRMAAAHLQLGRAYLALKNPESAYREINECVTLDPNNTDAQLQLAALLLARGQLDPAQAFAKKILEAQPGNVGAHKILGQKNTLGP